MVDGQSFGGQNPVFCSHMTKFDLDARYLSPIDQEQSNFCQLAGQHMCEPDHFQSYTVKLQSHGVTFSSSRSHLKVIFEQFSVHFSQYKSSQGQISSNVDIVQSLQSSQSIVYCSDVSCKNKYTKNKKKRSETLTAPPRTNVST